MRITRYWMTGCMALVLLAAARWVEAEDWADVEQSDQGRVSWTSHLPIDQAALSIEREARTLGLSVFARVAPQNGVQDGSVDGVRVLVLSDQDGHTPIIQTDSGDDRPQLPWSILMQRRQDGGTDVSMSDPLQATTPLGESPNLTEQLQHLVALSLQFHCHQVTVPSVELQLESEHPLG